MPSKRPVIKQADDMQAQLKAMLKRRHPDYAEQFPHWMFCDDTYKGGRNWFENNISRYLKEGDGEFRDRVRRAYRFNHTREVVDLIQKYIFKSPVARNTGDASVQTQAFWDNATLSGLSISQYMPLLSTMASIFGRVYVFVDSTKSGNIITLAEEKNAKARCYSYIVTPMDMLDIGWADDGTVNWCLVREWVRDDKDPLTSSGIMGSRYRLWTKTSWTLMSIQIRAKSDTIDVLANSNIPTQDDSYDVIIEGSGPVTVGEVPMRMLDNVICDARYSVPALISDIAYLDKASANYLSNLDAIIQDQTFSQLVMPAQNVMPGEETYDKIKEMGTKRVFLYDGEGGTAPAFISPDPRQANLIVTVINKIINEIYHSIGMGGERTKQDNAVGIDNSSGVAKAYDFERLNSLLVSKSQALKNCENGLVALVAKWNGIIEKNDLVEYADTFDVRSLFDEFTVAERLMLIEAPDDIRQEQMKQVIDKLFPALKTDVKQAMLANLKKWEPSALAAQIQVATKGGPVDGFGASSKATSGGSSPASKNPATANRQGQVTSQTKSAA